jgi:plasmid stabilization system protein ParE
VAIPHDKNVLVFYEFLGNEVRIVRVLHSARDISGLFPD